MGFRRAGEVQSRRFRPEVEKTDYESDDRGAHGELLAAIGDLGKPGRVPLGLGARPLFPHLGEAAGQDRERLAGQHDASE